MKIHEWRKRKWRRTSANICWEWPCASHCVKCFYVGCLIKGGGSLSRDHVYNPFISLPPRTAPLLPPPPSLLLPSSVPSYFISHPQSSALKSGPKLPHQDQKQFQFQLYHATSDKLLNLSRLVASWEPWSSTIHLWLIWLNISCHIYHNLYFQCTY